MQFTRWTDMRKRDVTLEEIETVLLNKNEDRECEKYKNWNIEKQSSISSNIFNGNEIKYNSYKISVDYFQPNIDINSEYISKKVWLIVYEVNKKINYIIDRNSDARIIIRRLMSYTGKGEIEENNIEFKSDEFVWLISKVYNQDNFFEGSNDFLGNLYLNNIKGFKGGTEDFLTKISTEGESVMNIISTLSFLIESKNLNQIDIDFDYKEHTRISVRLNSNKKVMTVDFNKYTGKLLKDSENKRNIEILIILYTEIIPIIKQSYQNDIEAELWNNDKFIEFIKEVRQALNGKIESRLNELSSSSVKLKEIESC